LPRSVLRATCNRVILAVPERWPAIAGHLQICALWNSATIEFWGRWKTDPLADGTEVKVLESYLRIERLASLFSGPQLLVLSRLLSIACCLTSGVVLWGQAKPPIKPSNDLQVGATIDFASPDYGSNTLRGFGFYSTYDFRRHLGVEAEFHQLNDLHEKIGISERTYEVGPRYYFHFGPLQPYAKLMVGRGVFNFPPDPLHPEKGPAANLAYNMWAGGFGADYRLRPSINIRAEYEFQQWTGFPPNGLTPRVFSAGVAFHFH